MNIKQFLLFFLVNSLLLFSVSSYYAISWGDIKDKAQKFIKEDALNKVFPQLVIVAGIAGGIYYLMTKKDSDNSEKVIKPISTISEERISAPDLIQLQVYSQFNALGGGGASCGYQALLRSMQVVKGKVENETDESLQKILNDYIPIGIYFGPEGEWRKKIIARRQYQALKNNLHTKFLSTLKNIGDEKITGVYKSALGFIEDMIVVIAQDPADRRKSYDFTDEGIQSYIHQALEKLKNQDNKTFIEDLQRSPLIKEYFDLDKMRNEFLSENFLLSLPKLIEEINNDPNLQEHFKGEWLDDGEVEYLWNEKNKDIIPVSIQCGFKAIANFELIGNPLIDPEFDETSLYIKENIKFYLDEKEQKFAIFILGTMRQTGEIVGTAGHWYPLIMHQDNKGKRKYYIMDSANNKDRRNDINARKIINLIEEQSVLKKQ